MASATVLFICLQSRHSNLIRMGNLMQSRRQDQKQQQKILTDFGGCLLVFKTLTQISKKNLNSSVLSILYWACWWTLLSLKLGYLEEKLKKIMTLSKQNYFMNNKKVPSRGEGSIMASDRRIPVPWVMTCNFDQVAFPSLCLDVPSCEIRWWYYSVSVFWDLNEWIHTACLTYSHMHSQHSLILTKGRKPREGTPYFQRWRYKFTYSFSKHWFCDAPPFYPCGAEVPGFLVRNLLACFLRNIYWLKIAWDSVFYVSAF